MNRRGFLKKCGLIPFVGCLTAVAKAGDSEGKLATIDPKDFNGLVPDTKPISVQKFHRGDRVFIGDLPEWMSHFSSNCYAIVGYSYCDVYGKPDPFNGHDYALDIEGKGYSSWYPEEVLTLLMIEALDKKGVAYVIEWPNKIIILNEQKRT